MALLLSKEEKVKQKMASKIKKSLKKEIENHQLGNSSASDSEEVDFSKIIYPIGHYINDREKMIEEMFSIIKGEKLRKMLPPLLKNYTLEELKADCLVHLLGMSKKRIFAILEGRELNSSSDTESDSEKSSDKSDKPEESHTTSTIIVRSDAEDDTLDISISKNDLDSLIGVDTLDKTSLRKQSSRREKKQKTWVKKEEQVPICSIIISDDETDRKKKKKLSKKTDVKIKEKKRKKHKNAQPTENYTSDSSDETVCIKEENQDDEKGEKCKSLLEILELEMRARAIKALLNKTPNSEEPVPVSILDMDTGSGDKSVKIKNIDKAISEVIDANISEKDDELCIVNDQPDSVCDIDLTAMDDTDVILVDNNDRVPATCNSDCVSIPLAAYNNTVAEKKLQDDTQTKSSDMVETDSPENSEKSKDDISWSERWAESKIVKDVVKSSKICANIRKRMRFARMLKQKQFVEDKTKKDTVDFTKVEESSVAQYNLIKLMDVKKSDTPVVDKSASESTKNEVN